MVRKTYEFGLEQSNLGLERREFQPKSEWFSKLMHLRIFLLELRVQDSPDLLFKLFILDYIQFRNACF
jgi:hypothetical protein